MNKYRTSYGKIKKFSIEKETAKTVFYNGRREAKSCEWQSWHDTFNEAKTHLIVKAQIKVGSLKLSLEDAKSKLLIAMELKEDEAI